MVPPAGIEPALPKERDFESRASTSSARGAFLGGGNLPPPKVWNSRDHMVVFAHVKVANDAICKLVVKIQMAPLISRLRF